VMRATECSGCGARMRADRPHCLRCGAKLSAAVAGVRVGIRGFLSPTWIMSAVAVGLLLTGVVGLRMAAPDRSSDVEAPIRPLFETADVNTAAPDRTAGPGAGQPGDSSAAALPAARAATASFKSGDYDVAVQQYRTALDREPANAEALNNLGQALLRLGRVDEALPYFKQAADLAPHRWAIRFNYGHALARTEQWEGAIAQYREAARIFPQDFGTRYNLGLALHKTGDERAAVEELRQAVSIRPDAADGQLALAISLERLESIDEAAIAYSAYLKLAPDGGAAAGVRAKLLRLGTAAVPPESTDRPRG
jgi:tetratricopeptide (TPR) repeat protein